MESFQKDIQSWFNHPGESHASTYYPTDHALVKSLYKYINIGVEAGDSCIIITNPSIIKSLRKSLETSAMGKGSYCILSAESVLEDIMTGDMPDKDKYHRKVDKILTLNRNPGQHVRIYSDMMSTLYKRGNKKAALELEKLWNELAKKHSFSLYCSYPSHVMLTASSKEINDYHRLSGPLETFR